MTGKPSTSASMPVVLAGGVMLPTRASAQAAPTGRNLAATAAGHALFSAAAEAAGHHHHQNIPNRQIEDVAPSPDIRPLGHANADGEIIYYTPESDRLAAIDWRCSDPAATLTHAPIGNRG
ncbi:MAG: hypothetical protein P0Y64_18415 [Candidatus Sphingomonas colombiensis]|nr:hypothetical protein [Sphingomonas sp.]WEK43264.1 MAG: hypothetical protein P0Y64_18415 [Sphingomonas sp.]